MPATSALPFGLWCGKIGVFVRHPIDEFADRGIVQQSLDIHSVTLQFGIGEIGDQGLLANRVHGDDVAPAPALRYGMVPDYRFPGRAIAQPAGFCRRCGYLFGIQMTVGVLLGVFSCHRSV